MVVVNNVRGRELPDGSILFPQVTNETRSIILEDYVPANTNPNCFVPKKFDFELLRPVFFNRHCYIIGKGPSIDDLKATDFDNTSPIICLNESIHVIEKLDLHNQIFVIQQDSQLEDSCRPRKATLIVSFFAAKFYSEFPNKLVYHPAELNCTETSITAEVAIAMIKKLKASSVTLCGFDAITKQDTGYSKSIKYPPNKYGRPQRFLLYAQRIEEALGNMQHEFK